MSLTTTSRNFKKGLKIFTAIVIIYYIGLLYVVPNTKNLLRKLMPEKNPPNPIYGQIDPPKFTRKSITNKAPRYVLNTKDGKIPENFPRKVPVYKLRRPQFSYLAGTEAEKNAAYLGYSQGDLTSDLKGDVLVWKSLLSGGTLEIVKSTGKISTDTNFTQRESEYKKGNINIEKAKIYSIDMLKNVNRADESYFKAGKQNVTLGRINGESLIQTTVLGEAQIARVDFFRNIDAYPVLGPDPKVGLLQVYLRNPTLGSSPFNYPKMDLNLHYIQPIDTDSPESVATYPIIYPDEAWDEIKKNNGVIVNVTPKDGNKFATYTPIKVETALINNIYLAYYETESFTTYIQPIYVFEGNYTTSGTAGGEITLYFPALTREFIKTTTVKQ